MSESLGKTLRKIRESRHLSVDEVSERTRLPKKIISAIEGDRLDEIASTFYRRTFIRSYSQFLRAMDEEAVKGFLSVEAKKELASCAVKNEEGSIVERFIGYKRVIAVGIVTVLGLWVLFFSLVKVGQFVRNLSEKHKAGLVRKQEAKGVSVAARPSLPEGSIGVLKKEGFPAKVTLQEAKQAAAKKPVLQKVRQQDRANLHTAGSKRAEGFELKITARYNVWIQVMNDGRLSFRGILRKKESDTWQAKKEIRLKLGNAGGVSLRFNGKALGVPGKKGEKKEIVVTKDGVKF